MKYYLLDYENVNSAGLDGVSELSADCRIVLFYTKNSSKIDLGLFDLLRDMKAELSIVEVHHGKQALDIQLASYLGYLIGCEPADTEYYIISKDKGFQNIQSFWPDRHITLCTSLRVDSVVAEEPVEQKAEQKKESTPKSSKSKAKSTKTKKKVLDPRNEVNNEIQKVLSKEGVDGNTVNSTASFVSKNLGRDGYKQFIYRGIIKEYGQKQGLRIYRLIKDIL